MKKIHEKLPVWAFAIVILISTIALAGWFANELTLARIDKNYIPMAPATALLFILSGCFSIYLLIKNKKSGFIQLSLLILMLFNSVLLIDSLLAYPLEVEHFFSKSNGTFKNVPIGRMSPLTIALFLIVLFTLFTITQQEKRLKRISIYFCSFGMFLSFILDLGYLYGTPLLYNRDIIPPALNTSVAFTFLYAGLLLGFGMNEKPLSLFIGESVSARLMRSFLPLTLLIIIIAGWLDIFFIQHFNDRVLVSALITIFSILALSFIILKLAKKIGNDIDLLLASRKKAEEALRVSEEKYHSIFENSSVAILLTSPDGEILSANNFACSLYGMTEAEICRAGRNGIVDLSDPRLPALLEKRRKTGRSTGELTFIRKDGRQFDCEISSVIFFDSEGKERTSMVIRDLTEQKQAESKIRKLNEELEQKVKERTLELEQKNADLERINKLFVGRELRMIELKNKIKEQEAIFRSISG